MKAAFLAKGGKVQTVAAGVAGDVRDREAHERAERESETHMQRVREERGYYGR